jgi:hypothetical protein
MTTRITIDPDSTPIPCEQCGRDTVRVAMVISGDGSLLGRTTICTSCRPHRANHVRPAA